MLTASHQAAADRHHHEVAHRHTHRNADEAIQAEAARVGADILAQYRQLAARLRQTGRDETVAVAHTADPAVRPAYRCASELYETAVSELDDLVAELLDSLERPPPRTSCARPSSASSTAADRKLIWIRAQIISETCQSALENKRRILTLLH